MGSSPAVENRASLVVVHGKQRGGFSVAEHRLQDIRASAVAAHGLSSCGSWTLEHRLNNWPRALVALQHVGSSQIRGQTCVS